MYILRLASTPVWDDIVDELVNEKGGLDNDACGMHSCCSNCIIYISNEVLNGCVCIILA